ncbi:MAG: redoxin domain-containing protein [Verrucomicrobia bacterium]|nr:redoxin domain-containing protein [Verrucomicrobiota bacterium]
MKKIVLTLTLIIIAAAFVVGMVWVFSPNTIKKTSPKLAEKLSQTGSSQEAGPAKIEDFHLLDQAGRSHFLHRQTKSKAVVLIATANGCPVVKEAAPRIKALSDRFASQGVTFWLVDSNPQDDRESIAKEAKALGLNLPVLGDNIQLVASEVGFARTCEAVCINTTDWTVVYRGAIDDQLGDAAKSKPSKNYLESALSSFLAGKKASPNRTMAKGTAISFGLAADASKKTISYVNEVAPILQKSCVSCHSPGNIGPFAMGSYEKVKGRGSMIREVLLAQRMPPWHADPHYGAFANERGLSSEQAHTLARWVEQGCPRGEGEDPLAAKPAPPAEDWPLGKPDYVVKFPKPEEIADNGVFDYRYIYARSPFPNNVWLRAAVVKPGNRKVVHHVLVMTMSPQELQARRAGQGQFGGGIDGFFAAYVPGYDSVPFPEGTGKLLPAGSVIVFQMHYTATGKPETDATEMGLYVCKEKPKVELKTKSAFNVQFRIPPGEANAESVAEYRFAKDSMLYELMPHMHLRGSWFKFEAAYPDGKHEMLLSVPNYDFKWQHLYRLKQPKRMPAGTRLICRGAHDNSTQNPDNPDASKEIHFGEQTFDEMFIGYINFSDIPVSTVAQNSGG